MKHRNQYQFDLSPGPGARPTDPETSHLAANKTPLLRADDRRAALLIHASRPDGLTDFELAALMGRQQTSAGKRRGELRDAGMIADTTRRRPAPSGSSAIVWSITAYGQAIVAQWNAGDWPL
jgi:hypothetical protein